MIWIAIGLSALALVGCLALLAVEWARRRSRAESTDDDDAPELTTLRKYGGATPRTVTIAITAIVTGLVLWFFGGPVVGALAALTVAGGLRWPRVRPVVIVLAPGALAGAALSSSPSSFATRSSRRSSGRRTSTGSTSSDGSASRRSSQTSWCARFVHEWLHLQPVMNRSPQTCPLPFHRRTVVRSTCDLRGDARQRDDRAGRRR